LAASCVIPTSLPNAIGFFPPYSGFPRIHKVIVAWRSLQYLQRLIPSLTPVLLGFPPWAKQDRPLFCAAPLLSFRMVAASEAWFSSMSLPHLGSSASALTPSDGLFRFWIYRFRSPFQLSDQFSLEDLFLFLELSFLKFRVLFSGPGHGPSSFQVPDTVLRFPLMVYFLLTNSGALVDTTPTLSFGSLFWCFWTRALPFALFDLRLTGLGL